MSSLASSQALPFIIRVLDGPLSTVTFMQGEETGVIKLAGRSLPYRPITFEGKQRVKTTWYPGNTTATQQVMGPTEEPTTINGVWKDRFLGDGNARRLAVIIDNIRRSGSPVEITWGAGVLVDLGGSNVFGPIITRRGVIARFKATYDRPQDVTWECEFHWSSQGETVAPAIVAVGVENPREGFTALSDRAAQISERVTAFVQDPHTRIVNLEEDIRTEMDLVGNRAIEIVQVLDATGQSATTLANIPRHVAERAIDVALKAKSSWANLVTALTNINSLAYDVKDDPKDTLEILGSRLDLMREATIAQEEAINLSQGLTGQLYPEVVGEARPPAGTDLRDLALEFYGDPDLWWMIAQFNGIIGSRVPDLPDGPSDNPFASRGILIPRRQGGNLGDIREGC